ncbi:hybrid sensor histidine kinase/response regulator [Pseudomonas sp.]|uniref:hybrid sensor histidine kinase/response regulator n=1 Tax=Pseudomonas sp. TaxID=306 RepID=UPI002B60C41F|nr:hybrid sensor histidine kinase/response regulator [Pseudomonas sp.]HUE94959.1 hybrid sensor histidine kinase/response regulator [Pseudomonas sp.]
MTPEEMRDAPMLELFRLEAEAQTQVLAAGLLLLERNPTLSDQLEACMRAAHSLKGAARIVGVEAGVQVAHAMEDCLVEAQEGRLQLSPAHIDALLLGSDLLLRIATPEALVAPAEIDAMIAQLAGQVGAPLLAPPAAAPTSALAVDAPADIAEPLPAENRPLEGGERVLRVTAERLDHLLDLSSKALVEAQRLKPQLLALQRGKRMQMQLGRMLENTQQALTEGATDTSALAPLTEARRVLGDCRQLFEQQAAALDEFAWQAAQRAQQLYDTALACRMRPLADVLRGQARMIRDLARSLDKQVRLQVEGDATQVDRDVLERLDAPLIHLLRNALDHGIEAPAERLAAGKPAEGVISIKARQQAGSLLLEIADDGAGVDLSRLRGSIVQRQLASEETAAQLSEEELLSFLFLPGFSLREQVTEVSGRGVGLDAVQHMLRQLRGGIQLQQQSGRGMRFLLEVPLTLSVVRSLVVEVGGEAYAFPLAHIERMCELEPAAIVQLEGQQHFTYEGRSVGLVAAGQLLQRPVERTARATIPVVLVGVGEALYGIAVERIIGERTLVVLPLDARLGNVQNVLAGAVLDDGAPVLILNVEDLQRSLERLRSNGRLERIDRSGQEPGVARKRVLVVDDSLTVRELQRKLLLNSGYEVAVAVDGMDGWNALRAESFDLLITDIDMPRMDGIELVTLLRRDHRMQSLPVMVVSYKDREEDRRRGLEAGADYYLGKASFHDEELLDAVAMLIGRSL